MIRRHEEQMMNRFDALYANGWSQFTRDELLLWYGLSKLTKTIINDLLDRWLRTLEDYLGEDAGVELINDGKEEILVLQKGDSFTFIRSSSCKTLREIRA